jgi:hypothetical protein
MIIYVNYKMKIASTIVETKDSECKCIERDTENGNYVIVHHVSLQSPAKYTTDQNCCHHT